MSHEIRTPLNTVLLGIKLLRRDLSRDVGVANEMLDTVNDIEVSCATAIETLNGLLDYEKLESGIMKLDKKKQSVWPLIRDAIKPFNIQVGVMSSQYCKLLLEPLIMTGSSSGSGASDCR